jgi:hypothetical protein
MLIWPSLRPALHSFLLHSFLKAEDLPLTELLSQLCAVDRSSGADSLCEGLKRNLEELNLFNELFSLFNVAISKKEACFTCSCARASSCSPSSPSKR